MPAVRLDKLRPVRSTLCLPVGAATGIGNDLGHLVIFRVVARSRDVIWIATPHDLLDLASGLFGRMNKTHSHFSISNEDYLFVLSTFVINPIDWIDRFGWRRLCDNEKQSMFLFWRNVGQRMNLQGIPESLPRMESESWQYVQGHFSFDQANQRVADGTIEIVKGWLPVFLKPLVRPVASALLDDRTRNAVGLQRPSAATIHAVRWALKTKAVLKRFTRSGHQPNWPSGHQTYAGGYQIDDLALRRILELESSELANQRD